MAVNKVIYNNETLIDLTTDTVTADKLLKGYTAHDKKGNKITGTHEETLPTGTKTITANGTYDVTDYATAKVNVPVPSGYVKPSGTKYITTTSSVDVTSYAKAQIQSSTLIAENIKKGISILGVTGTYEGSGGGSSNIETCTVTYNPFSPAPPGDCQIKYTDSTGKINTTNYNPMQSIKIVCQKNTLIFFEGLPVPPKITAEDGSPWYKIYGGNLVVTITSNTIIKT